MSYKWLLWFNSAVPDRFYDVKLFLDVVSVVITAVDGADGLPQATTPSAVAPKSFRAQDEPTATIQPGRHDTPSSVT